MWRRCSATATPHEARCGRRTICTGFRLCASSVDLRTELHRRLEMLVLCFELLRRHSIACCRVGGGCMELQHLRQEFQTCSGDVLPELLGAGPQQPSCACAAPHLAACEHDSHQVPGGGDGNWRAHAFTCFQPESHLAVSKLGAHGEPMCPAIGAPPVITEGWRGR